MSGWREVPSAARTAVSAMNQAPTPRIPSGPSAQTAPRTSKIPSDQSLLVFSRALRPCFFEKFFFQLC